MFKKYCFLIGILYVLVSCSAPGSKVELVLDSKSALGEGAIWNFKTNRLYWIDITGKLFNIYNPVTGNNKDFMTGQMIGTVVPSESGKAIVALQMGIYEMDVETGSKKLIVDPEPGKPGNRFNDGKNDPAGRLWVGTMSVKGENGAGSLYRININGTSSKMIENVSVSNGIAWSLDFTKMYYIDTPTQKVMGYDYNNETGEISNPKIVVEVSKEMGSPDGMTLDAEGNLWIALWGGFAVGCWNPKTGELIRKIGVPAKNVTSCAFGDVDLGTLYITSSRQKMTEKELEKFPHSGGLFKVRPGVMGVPASFYKGEF